MVQLAVAARVKHFTRVEKGDATRHPANPLPLVFTSISQRQQ